MKKVILILVMVLIACGGTFSQAPIYDPARQYDTVMDSNTCYLFSMPKPCIKPGVYTWSSAHVLVQEYTITDTIIVYGVATPMDNHYSDHPFCDNLDNYQSLLMSRVGTSPTNPLAYSMELVDSVTLNRSHPRFCWFYYESPCDAKDTLTTPCYEFYFDTPERLNRLTGTFCVGRSFGPQIQWVGWQEYGGEYSGSTPSNLYQSLGYEGEWANRFFLCEGSYDNRWGVFFPIIGFRCGPIRQYWLDSYTGDSAVVRWRSVEQGTQYNVRLVGSDGTDTTFVTPDTTLTLTPLSDSVRYDVMLRKQCHYATTNYDTTVYGQWLSGITFGPVPSDTTSGGDDTVGIAQPQDEAFALAPNPASGTVQVLLPASAVGGHLTLCDLAGRELLAIEIRRTPVTFDVSKLPAGTYLVNLLTPQGRTSRTLLVE